MTKASVLPIADESAPALFSGPSAVATLCRSLQWSATALRAPSQWSPSLRIAAEMVVASPVAMLLLWGDDFTQIYSDAYIPLLGERHPAALGSSALETWPESWHLRAPLHERVLRGESVMVEETPHPVMRDGTPEDAWFTFGYTPVRDEAGAIRGVLMSAFETTGEVLATRKEAAANRAKGDFLAVMSHELRTPLNAIGGYAELLGLGVRGPITADQRVDLDRIQHSQQHLLHIIDGVLDYAKVTTGILHYAVEDVPMDELLARCEALVAAQVRGKQLTLLHSQCGTRLTARADGEKVQQIVLNLLSNAIKFTAPGGQVTLSCASEENKRLVVRVSDTGSGIAMSDMECIFQPFVQVDGKRTRAHEGTGLGLAISRDLARGMGGELVAESTAGEGSVFTLTLACGRGDTQHEQLQRRTGDQSERSLMVPRLVTESAD